MTVWSGRSVDEKAVFQLKICGLVKGGKPCNGMTIILAGPNETALKLIKYELKQLIRVARHMLLRIYKIMLDQDMMQSMTPEVRATLANPAVANIFFHSSLES